MNLLKRGLALLLSLMLLLAVIGGCAKKSEPTEPAGLETPEETAEAAAETPEASAAPERADGEEFEATIMIEGMEETVKYRHVINKTAGFAIDFEFENFVRRSLSDREMIVWGYDDPENPENYLEVSYSPDKAETVAAAVTETLSRDYQVHQDTITLDGAGECIHLDASATPDGTHTADVLQAVYILPASDGCRVAALRYIPEGSDGFGRRLASMVNTITVMDPQGERALSDEQALAAIRRYCVAGNPSLEEMAQSDERTVSWQVTEYSEEQIVVLFRSYTGSETRYYIDPVSGDAKVTEFVSGIMTEEQPSDETLNVWDYVSWWQS